MELRGRRQQRALRRTGSGMHRKLVRHLTGLGAANVRFLVPVGGDSAAAARSVLFWIGFQLGRVGMVVGANRRLLHRTRKVRVRSVKQLLQSLQSLFPVANRAVFRMRMSSIHLGRRTDQIEIV